MRRTGPSLADLWGTLRADYDAARQSRFRSALTGVAPLGSGADYHYRNERDYYTLIEQARAYDRNDPVVGQGVRRVVSNVLQGGMRLDPQTSSPAVNERLSTLWQEWCESPAKCDIEGVRTFHALAQLALHGVIVDGDVFVLLTEDGSVQAVEAHRCRTPRGQQDNVIHGVQVDPTTRKRLAYWFARDDDFKRAPKMDDMSRYPARSESGDPLVLHLLLPRRLSQTRGVTTLAPVSDVVGMHNDIQFAKLVQQQIVSCFAILREQQDPTTLLGMPDPTGDTALQTGSNTSLTVQDLAPGMEVFGRPGEKLSGFAPNVPNPEFFDHAKLILSFIAINLDLPLAVLLLDPSETNFSGWRGAIDQARQGWQAIQQHLIAQLYRPVYLWQVGRWLNTDRELQTAAKDGVDVRLHRWTPPYWPYIEPFKDAQADSLIVEKHLNSRREVLAKRGLDIDDLDPAAVRDEARLIRLAIEQATELNRDYPDAGVTWRDVLGLQSAPPPAQETQSGGDDPGAGQSD